MKEIGSIKNKFPHIFGNVNFPPKKSINTIKNCLLNSLQKSDILKNKKIFNEEGITFIFNFLNIALVMTARENLNTSL